MNLKVRLHNRKLYRRIRRILHDRFDQEINEVLSNGGTIDNAIDKIEGIMESEKEELKFFKDYLAGKF